MATSDHPTHLVLLCCHGIYIPKDDFPLPPKSTLTPSTWLIAPFQTGEEPTFTTHLRTALALLSQDPTSILVISGSKTRSEINLSEARSYLYLAQESGFFNLSTSEDHHQKQQQQEQQHDLEKRIILEEKALDSYANLLFGIIEFWRSTSTWPEKITIVSHEFKRERFLGLHCTALGIPTEKVVYVGINPGYMDPTKREEYDVERCKSVESGERERGVMAWKSDEDGRGETLRGKRWSRNWWGVEQRLFVDGEERRRSGCRCENVEFEWDGKIVTEEYLVDGLKAVYTIEE